MCTLKNNKIEDKDIEEQINKIGVPEGAESHER